MSLTNIEAVVGLLVTPDLSQEYVNSICSNPDNGDISKMGGQVGEIIEVRGKGHICNVWWPHIGVDHVWSTSFLAKINK